MTTIAVGLLLGVTAPVVMLAAMDTALAAPVATNTMTELGVDTARLLVALLWTTIRLLPHGAATKSPTTAITHRPQRPMATVAHTIDPLATSHLANLHTLLERDTRLVNTSAVVATDHCRLPTARNRYVDARVYNGRLRLNMRKWKRRGLSVDEGWFPNYVHEASKGI
jgi:predicted lysophospholipase L1 biosynthesis ABC-type transport system permease subunit